MQGCTNVRFATVSAVPRRRSPQRPPTRRRGKSSRPRTVKNPGGEAPVGVAPPPAPAPRQVPQTVKVVAGWSRLKLPAVLTPLVVSVRTMLL